MKINLLILFLCFFGAYASGQIVNDDATIVISEGASLKIQTSIINTNSGILTINGELELDGNFQNSGELNMGAMGNIKFVGDQSSMLASGGSEISRIEVAKINESVILEDDLHLLNSIQFSNGSTLALAEHNVRLGENFSILGVNSDSYFLTDGSGKLFIPVEGDGTYEYPVGSSQRYNPLTVEYSGSNYNEAFIGANSRHDGHPNLPLDATDYLLTFWQLEAEGIDGFEAEWSASVEPEDIQGLAGDIVIAEFRESDWYYTDQGLGVNSVSGVTTASVVDLSASNYYSRIRVKAVLQGAYNAGTGLMSTTLNNLNLLPLESPYTDAPATVTEIPSDVTDWVKLEFRDPENPGLVLTKASAFLRNDGTITGLNGIYSVGIKEGDDEYVVSVHHRNHLAVRTVAALDAVNPVQYDISSSLTQVYQNPLITGNAAMAQISGSNPTFALWGGNGNGNANVRYTGPSNDNNALLNVTLNGNKSQINNSIYSNVDYNMNGNVRYTGPSNDNNTILNQVLNGNKSTILNQHL